MSMNFLLSEPFWHKPSVLPAVALPPPPSVRSPGAMACPAVVPSQMVFCYMDGGTECRLQLSFAAHGAQPKVALRLRNADGSGAWSGWHGSWALKDEKMTVHVHWRGVRSTWLRHIEFFKVHEELYLWNKGGRLIPVGARMSTDLPARKMLADQPETEDSWTML